MWLSACGGEPVAKSPSAPRTKQEPAAQATTSADGQTVTYEQQYSVPSTP